MATISEDIIKETSERHNNKLYYISTKLNYMADLKLYLQNSYQVGIRWTRELVAQKIKEIKEMKKNKEFTPTEHDVALLNGEEILIVADTIRQVLPYEDYFDVFIDFHHTLDHLKSNEMFQKISEQYVIDENILSIFMNSCTICPKKASNLICFNELVHIDILGMCHKPDDEFRYILIYIEVATNFVLLRPLLNTNINEVSAELFKIFIDIGPPLAITATNVDLLINVMQTLKLTPIKYDIPIYGQKTFHQMSGTCIFELEKWLAYSSNNNWAFGCYVVQYILNSRGTENAKNKVFGIKQSKDLNIPYEPQQDNTLNNNKDKDHSNKNMQYPQAVEQNLPTNTTNMSVETELHVEEDLGIDYGIVKTENGSESDMDIEEKLDCTIIANKIQKLSGACWVCSKKGVSAMVKCSICEKNVHLLCAKRFPVPGFEQTRSKIVCSKC